jgi:hypothetical protein
VLFVGWGILQFIIPHPIYNDVTDTWTFSHNASTTHFGLLILKIDWFWAMPLGLTVIYITIVSISIFMERGILWGTLVAIVAGYLVYMFPAQALLLIVIGIVLPLVILAGVGLYSANRDYVRRELFMLMLIIVIGISLPVIISMIPDRQFISDLTVKETLTLDEGTYHVMQTSKRSSLTGVITVYRCERYESQCSLLTGKMGSIYGGFVLEGFTFDDENLYVELPSVKTGLMIDRAAFR